MLQAWRGLGLGLYVYSSGLAEAQRPLFGHSRAGDLTGLIDGYFDTAVRANRSRKLTADRRRPGAAARRDPVPVGRAGRIAAARAAGMRAVRIARDGPVAPGGAARFDDLEVASPRPSRAERKKPSPSRKGRN